MMTKGDRMVTHDFLSGVCVGMAVVNLMWFIAATVFIKKEILDGGKDGTV